MYTVVLQSFTVIKLTVYLELFHLPNKTSNIQATECIQHVLHMIHYEMYRLVLKFIDMWKAQILAIQCLSVVCGPFITCSHKQDIKRTSERMYSASYQRPRNMHVLYKITMKWSQSSL